MFCNKCSTEKSEEEFNFNKTKGRRESCCKVCRNVYTRQHYKDNKDYYKKKARCHVKMTRKWYREYKSKLSCEKCGENHTACIEFHHIDGKNKEIGIYRATTNGWSIKRILKEIEKCSVLCSNCHRKLHYELRKSLHSEEKNNLSS